jgi:hypothetical protein
MSKINALHQSDKESITMPQVGSPVSILPGNEFISPEKLKTFKIIDEDDDDDEDEENFYKEDFLKNPDYDDKYEFDIQNQLKREKSFNSFETNLSDFEVITNAEVHNEVMQPDNSKSKFYFAAEENIQDNDFVRIYEEENILLRLNNIFCLFPANNQSEEHDIQVQGRLLLTNFQLVFIAAKPCKNVNELNLDSLSLFNHEKPLSFVIPIKSIYEIRTCKCWTKGNDYKIF